MNTTEFRSVFRFILFQWLLDLFENWFKYVFLFQTDDCKRLTEANKLVFIEIIKVLTETFYETVVQISVPPVSIAIQSVQVKELVSVDLVVVLNNLLVLLEEAPKKPTTDQVLWKLGVLVQLGGVLHFLQDGV